VYEAGIGRLINEAHKCQLGNLKIIQADAVEVLTEHIENDSLSRFQLFFEALEAILIRLSDDLSKYLIVGENIVRKVWGAYTGSIFTSLMSRNKASHIKTTLKLLTAMTMLGETSAKAILTQIDFSKYY
jgi:hypothetical protein